jgi:hypothetical protein
MTLAARPQCHHRKDPTVETTSHSNLGRLIAGVGMGALLMYTLDPQQGRRRLAVARDRAGRVSREASHWAGVGWRDLSHRAQGAGARLRQMVQRSATEDEVLLGRIRAQLGRVVTRPHAVEVACSSGRVCLRGPVLEREHEPLLRAVRSVRGVRQLESQLALHPTSATVPGQPGVTARSDAPRGALPRRWTPGTQLLAVAGGVGLVLLGLAVRRHPEG